MTKATREALIDVVRILHEAGWDRPVSAADGAEVKLGRIAEELEELADQTRQPDRIKQLAGEIKKLAVSP